MNIMDYVLKDKLAVVTGGTRGIGKAIVEQLQTAGAKIIYTGRSSESSAQMEGLYYQVDFADEESTKRFANFLQDKQPDILINNAGINIIDEFQEVNLDDFSDIHQVNVVAPFLLCKAVIPGMKTKSWGRIINISSIFGKVSKAGRASYSASKFAIDGMTAALAAEVASFGILANCVAPGFIATDLTVEVLGEENMGKLAKQVPVGRLGKAEEVAKFVIWLASENNTYISGQNLVIDGGFTRV